MDMQWRLRRYLLLFVLAIFIVSFIAYIVLGTFSPHKTAQSLLTLELDRTEYRLDTYFENVAAQGLSFSTELSQEIGKNLAEKGIDFSQVSGNQEFLYSLQKDTYSILYNTIRRTDASGVFIILDATVNTTLSKAEHSRSGTYLKLVNINTPMPANPNIVWTRGMHEIGYMHELTFHNKWQLEFDVSRIPWYDDVLRSATKDLSESYYYSPVLKLYGTWENVMLMVVPIVGQNG
jgi:hypothetical protein